jgi:hypothetical protein
LRSEGIGLRRGGADLQAGQLAEVHRCDAGEKLVVVHGEQRQVALDADGQHLGVRDMGVDV